METYYDAEYFNWQKDIGAFGGMINKLKFNHFIKPEDRVIDFGCGGGFLLANIHCKEKIGIELNDSAREHAARIGTKAVSSANAVEDNWADVIISNNALEHTHEPLKELKALYPKLKRGGKIIFVVPCEHINYQYYPEDVNQHMYSWSPMCAGNLFTLAGFRVLESKPYIHKWPPHYMVYRKIFGEKIFHFICRIWARFERTWFQVRVIAVKD